MHLYSGVVYLCHNTVLFLGFFFKRKKLRLTSKWQHQFAFPSTIYKCFLFLHSNLYLLSFALMNVSILTRENVNLKAFVKANLGYLFDYIWAKLNSRLSAHHEEFFLIESFEVGRPVLNLGHLSWEDQSQICATFLS